MHSRRELALASFVALARTALCAWRAAHQSIAIDEAHTFNFYVDAPWSNFYARYIPHNHVLYSLLARFSVDAFGRSDLAFRLPSVIAGFFLTLGAFRVLEISTPRLIRWIALLTIALQPLLLDFSVAARGYGLGLAFLTWAIYFAMCERPTLAGTLLGFAIAAQLSTTIPALAIVIATAILMRKPWAIAVPAAAVATLICAIPLRHATLDSFNLGYATIRESLYSLVFPSTTNRAGLFVIPHRGLITVEIASVLLIAVFIAIQSIYKRKLVPMAFLISIVIVIAAHYASGMNYPVDRTGLYLILLFALAWPIVAGGVNQKWQRLHILVAIFFVIQFAVQFDAHSFRVWRFDADTKFAAQILRDACGSRPESSVAISSVWINQQSLDYYRRTLPIPALKPVEFHDPPPLSGFDFYVLNRADNPPLDHFRILYTGAKSGLILAAPKP
jgi:hypothetical protein